jgi:hypothetical protein
MRNLCEISDDCNVQYTSWLGDGICDGFTYDTEACCRDGGDCNPNLPVFGDCIVSNLCQILPSELSKLGDGICDDSYRFNITTEACCWDGFDCGPPEQEQEQEQFFGECKVSAECSVTTLYWFRLGDGYCDDYFPYNSKECCWDGGDCSRGLSQDTIVTIVVFVVIFLICLVSVVFQYRTTRSRANNGSTSTAQPAATIITGAPPPTEEERISERRELILMSIIHKVNYLEQLIIIFHNHLY